MAALVPAGKGQHPFFFRSWRFRPGSQKQRQSFLRMQPAQVEKHFSIFETVWAPRGRISWNVQISQIHPIRNDTNRVGQPVSAEGLKLPLADGMKTGSIR